MSEQDFAALPAMPAAALDRHPHRRGLAPVQEVSASDRAVAIVGLAGLLGLVVAATASAEKFTVVGLPDTQNYSDEYPRIFEAQTAWIVRNQEAFDIRFVSHYGDIVDNGNDERQWSNARRAMSRLEDANIAHGVVAGNHDVLPSGTVGQQYDDSYYLANFGADRYVGREWFGGASASGLSTYQTFSGGGIDYIALHLHLETPIEELIWAQEVLNQNKDKAVMVTTHRYLQDATDYTGGIPIIPSGRYPDIWYTVEGQYNPDGIKANEFFNNFVQTNKNIFLVNAGHFHEEFNQTSTNLYGNAVHEVLADYQDDPRGGNGYLRLMEFDTEGNRINFQSYSPTLDNYLTKTESQFSLNVNWSSYATRNQFVSFQNGIGGYQGTQDTWVSEAAKNQSFGARSTIVVDDDINNSLVSDRQAQGLLRFDNMFTDQGEPGKIPLGATIIEATLRIAIEDDIDNPLYDADFDVYMMARDWSEDSTWNSLNNGLSQGEDLGQFLGRLEGDNNPDGQYFRILDVTSAVQMWADGGANFGFAFVPEIISGNDDGIEIWSSEALNALLRPALDVEFITGGLATVPGPASVSLLFIGGLFLLNNGKRARRRPAPQA